MIIPKTFHHIWLGGPMPKKFKRYRKSWMKHHPDWNFNLITDRNIPDYIEQETLDLSNTYSEMSDAIRWPTIYHEGGIYLDTDFECFKNIEPLIKDLNIFISSEDNRHLCGGIFGAVPGHPLIKRLVDLIPSALRNTVGKTSDLRIGPTFVTNNISWDEITVLNKEYFYPYLPGQNWLRDNLKRNNICYAAHHWAKSW